MWSQHLGRDTPGSGPLPAPAGGGVPLPRKWDGHGVGAVVGRPGRSAFPQGILRRSRPKVRLCLRTSGYGWWSSPWTATTSPGSGFWSALLGLPLRESLPRWQRLGPFAGGLMLTFQPVGQAPAGRPAVRPDVATTDGRRAVACVVELGGAFVEEHRYDEGVVRVVADPEGHVFCLVEYARGCGPRDPSRFLTVPVPLAVRPTTDRLVGTSRPGRTRPGRDVLVGESRHQQIIGT